MKQSRPRKAGLSKELDFDTRRPFSLDHAKLWDQLLQCYSHYARYPFVCSLLSKEGLKVY